MVETQIVRRAVKDELVLAALRAVPRHRFVPEHLLSRAYEDTALPIGFEQTISQPFVVAAMTEKLRLTGGERVLEIGTGSGYQAAVLSHIVAEVFTVEIIPGLATRAASLFRDLGLKNIAVRTGDGWHGWPEKAPFDAIVVTAAPEKLPEALPRQLKMGGRLVIPLGPRHAQELVTFTKTPAGLSQENHFPVRFVPFLRDKPVD